MSYRIAPGVAPRLYFVVLDSTGEPVTDLAVADITSIAYRTITGGVAGATSSGLSLTAAAVTDAHSTGSTGPVRASDGWYFCDAPVGAADANADEVELVVVLDEATHVVYPSRHVIDVKISTRSTFDHTTDEVTTDAASRAASQADVSGLATQASVDTIDTIVDAIKLKTDNLPADPADASDINDSFNAIAAGILTLATKTDLDDAETAIITACATATGFAVPGDAMALTSAERSAVAGAVDVALINQSDGANLIGALADAIAADWVAGDASPLAIIEALKADATYTTLIADAAAGKTAAELVRDRLTAARAEKLDRDLATSANVTSAKTEIIDRGNVAWITGSGSGASGPTARDVIVTVTEADSSPTKNVKGAIVSIEGSSDSQITDQFGVATLRTLPGEYTLQIDPPIGYATPDDIDVEVIATDVPVSAELTPLAAPSIVGAESCLCSLQVVNVNNQPVTGAILTATTKQRTSFAGDSLIMPEQTKPSSVNGLIQVVLAREVSYKISVKHERSEVSFNFTVPDSNAAVIREVVL